MASHSNRLKPSQRRGRRSVCWLICRSCVQKCTLDCACHFFLAVSQLILLCRELNALPRRTSPRLSFSAASSCGAQTVQLLRWDRSSGFLKQSRLCWRKGCREAESQQRADSPSLSSLAAVELYTREMLCSSSSSSSSSRGAFITEAVRYGVRERWCRATNNATEP